MPTIDARVAASADDAGEQSNGVVAINLTAINVDGVDEWLAFRVNVTIPDGATIDAAYLTLQFDGSTTDEPDLVIYGEDTATPAVYTTASNSISTRTRTTASVDYANTNLGAPGAFNTPSIVSIINELMGSYSYASGAYMAFMMTSKNNDTNRDASITMYDGSSTTAPLLHIEYTEASADDPPVVVLNTADGGTLSSTPTLAFTGTADSAEPIRYQVQISTASDFDATETLTDEVNYLDSSVGGLHSNGDSSLTWDGEYQVDDRFGQSFQVTAGGLLTKISVEIGMDEVDVDGTAVVRLYNHVGVYGTTSAPANAAAPADTPTPGWLAESDPIAIVYPAGPTGWLDFEFTGANLLWLEPGYYVWICDWRPVDGIYTNAIELSADVTPTHAGNAYVDGENSSNNGVRTDFDVYFGALQAPHQLDVVSGTDSGFSGTPDSTDPFASAQQVTFTVQSGDALYAGQTYYWRVRGIDPDGTNTYGDWTTARTFVVGSDTMAALSGAIRTRMATHLAR